MLLKKSQRDEDETGECEASGGGNRKGDGVETGLKELDSSKVSAPNCRDKKDEETRPGVVPGRRWRWGWGWCCRLL